MPRAHDALLCVQTNAKIHETNRFKFSGSGHYLKSAAEMRAIFSETPEGVRTNTLWVAERANVEIEFGQPILPSFPVPEGPHRGQLSARAQLRRCRRCVYGETLAPHVRERIEYEPRCPSSRWASPAYFLVVWDLVEYARARPASASGRAAGSAAGSCVGVLACASSTSTRSGTTCCSSASSNPGRKQMPDIDMDFDSRRPRGR